MSTTVTSAEPCEKHEVSCCTICIHGLPKQTTRTMRGVCDEGFGTVMTQIANEIGATVAEITGNNGCQLKLPLEVIGSALGLRTEATKTRLAAAICGRAGIEWSETDDSTWSPSGGGENITVRGWWKVLRAVRLLGISN